MTFHLPVPSNIYHDELDMCSIKEEFTDPNVDVLSIEPTHCAEQLTGMDAVSGLDWMTSCHASFDLPSHLFFLQIQKLCKR